MQVVDRMENGLKNVTASSCKGITSPAFSPERTESLHAHSQGPISYAKQKTGESSCVTTTTTVGMMEPVDTTSTEAASMPSLVSNFLPSVASQPSSIPKSSFLGLPTPIPSPVAQPQLLQYGIRQPAYGYSSAAAPNLALESSSAHRMGYMSPQFYPVGYSTPRNSAVPLPQPTNLAYPCASSYANVGIPFVRLDNLIPAIFTQKQLLQNPSFAPQVNGNVRDGVIAAPLSDQLLSNSFLQMGSQNMPYLPIPSAQTQPALLPSGYSNFSQGYAAPLPEWPRHQLAGESEVGQTLLSTSPMQEGASKYLSQSYLGPLVLGSHPYTNHYAVGGYHGSHSAPNTPGRAKVGKPALNNAGKHKRRKPSKIQTQVLNAVFSHTCFPSTKVRTDLSRELDMSMRSVQVWFQNRRQSLRHKKNQNVCNSVDSGNLTIPVSELVQQFKREEAEPLSNSENSSPVIDSSSLKDPGLLDKSASSWSSSSAEQTHPPSREVKSLSFDPPCKTDDPLANDKFANRRSNHLALPTVSQLLKPLPSTLTKAAVSGEPPLL